MTVVLLVFRGSTHLFSDNTHAHVHPLTAGGGSFVELESLLLENDADSINGPPAAVKGFKMQIAWK